MSHSQRLRLSDVRKAFRLLGEVRELGADPIAWRSHTLESLENIIGLQFGIATELSYPAGTPHTMPETIATVGGSGLRNWKGFVSFLASPEAESCPVYCSISRWRDKEYTRIHGSADGVKTDFEARTWYNAALFTHIRAAGLDRFLYSQHVLPVGQTAHVISLGRNLGEKPFTDGQRRLLHLFHDELSQLWLPAKHDELGELSPRLRQTLNALQIGQSEKQVARGLGISAHTVHNYVKELHRRLQVSSRGELLAYCNFKTRDFAPHVLTSWHWMKIS